MCSQLSNFMLETPPHPELCSQSRGGVVLIRSEASWYSFSLNSTFKNNKVDQSALQAHLKTENHRLIK